jgi:hypothetical protein
VGHEAIAALHASTSKSGAVTLNNPVERGLIRNWSAATVNDISPLLVDYANKMSSQLGDMIQVILEHIYKKELRVNPKEHPVCIDILPLSDGLSCQFDYNCLIYISGIVEFSPLS